MTATDPARTAAPLLGAAFTGPIDIVGDVHGEIDALEDLLRILGYTGRGDHPAARRLVFIGDLCDRGPDSPAVIRRVAGMVREGTAQCLLGNHELNLLRGSRKEANGWFYADDHDRRGGRFEASRPAADEDERASIRAFLSQLPLALERPDLRLVHACWDEGRIAELRDSNGRLDAVELHRLHAQRSETRARESGLRDAVDDLMQHYRSRLRDPAADVPMLDALAELDADYQMCNPVRVLTSGTEHRATRPFFMAGKWRMVERGAWWQQYAGPLPVIFGHYWRWPTGDAGDRFGPYARNPFPGRAANEWLGTSDSAFCIDFCVGARFAERRGWPTEPFRTRLGAVRWPERELLFDDGSGAGLVAPPRAQGTPA